MDLSSAVGHLAGQVSASASAAAGGQGPGGLAAHLALDLGAVSLLTFGVFFPRHRRRELVPAFLALNVGLFAVVAALARGGTGGGLALGFGLFGVLSIVRLRSDTVQHEEVAYYFTTLVLGLVCGLPGVGIGTAAALAGLLLAVLFVADHPRLYARDRRVLVTLDGVYADPVALRAELAGRLGEPHGWSVRDVDYVRDLMVVELRYREPAAKRATGGRTQEGRNRSRGTADVSAVEARHAAVPPGPRE